MGGCWKLDTCLWDKYVQYYSHLCSNFLQNVAEVEMVCSGVACALLYQNGSHDLRVHTRDLPQLEKGSLQNAHN
jgi:hypothetical protein